MEFGWYTWKLLTVWYGHATVPAYKNVSSGGGGMPSPESQRQPHGRNGGIGGVAHRSQVWSKYAASTTIYMKTHANLHAGSIAR